MTLAQLRAGLAAALALTAVAGASCARAPARRGDTFVAARHLGDSTASPGGDPDRPVARSIDTHEVSATIRRAPEGPAPSGPPVPAGPPPASAPTATQTPVTTTPVTNSPPTTTPGPTDTGSPGVFSPPPPPPR